MPQTLFTAGAARIARVALPVPVNELFDYRVPAALAAGVRPGSRVQVRLRERFLVGVVVECRRESRFRGHLHPIGKLIDREPVLSQAMLEILREVAGEVLCPLGIALAAALPRGSAPRVLPGFSLTPRGAEALARGAVRGSIRQLLERLRSGPRNATALRRAVASGEATALLRDAERDGLVVPCSLDHAAAARTARERIAALPPDLDLEAAAEGLARAPKQAALLRRLAAGGPTPVAALRRRSPNAPALVRALAARGLVQVFEREAPRDVLGPPLEGGAQVSLTCEQARALAPIVEAIRSRTARTFLLHGVTGSGKTEIYLRAVDEARRAGRQALVLVPEITLTHQILARLRARFGDNLAVLHSGLRPGERLEQWQRLARGSTPIAVGARSALFAPLENLGVIVIDEEHDTAYKNGEGFRYHARDLAVRRAARAGCPVVLGSATPALETRFAADRGELQRLVLPARIGGRPLPGVEIVDLARERALTPRGGKVVLSQALRRALGETLDAGAQAILFLNRRGFSTQVLCFECGHGERCENCDIALVYHASEQKLRCHYCNFQSPPPEVCAGCGAPETALLGLGTERLEEEVRTHFPQARIARLDRDSARRRGFVESVLRDLRERRLDVLIGTQMVAKGHDFPGVRLVGAVLADIGLHLPDFRAAERTFQLLTQVAGRAGRDAAPGRVIVQTFSPAHYAIEPVRTHDYERFYAEELSHRASLGYPPFGRLVHVLVSGPDEGGAGAAAETLAAALTAHTGGALPEGLELLGPAPAPLSRLRGRHRVQLLVKGAPDAPLRPAALALLDAAQRLPEGIQATVDPYPMNLL